MEQRLREYVEGLFASAPQTQQMNELREEIICNTILRYHDLLSEGKDEAQAYQTAVDGIGDVSELFESELPAAAMMKGVEISDEQAAEISSRNKLFKGIAVALYIICLTPPILLSPVGLSNLGAAMMFFIISAATGLLVYAKATKFLPLERDAAVAEISKKSAIMLAAAVGMYISCVTPPILLSDTPLTEISAIFMFAIIAAATFLIIFRKRTKANARLRADAANRVKKEEAVMEKHVARKGLYRCFVAILWVCASVLYMAVTVLTACVRVTWLIFLIAFALQKLMRALFDLAEVRA